MNKQVVILLMWVFSVVSCTHHQQVEKQETTIEDSLQVQIASLLEDKLVEGYALSGQVVLMEVRTGAIKAMVGLERKDTLSPILPIEIVDKPRESSLFRAIAMLAMLESGKLGMSDEVDTRNGVLALPDTVVRDHNWRYGGYGILDAWRGFSYNSVVAQTLFMQRTFANENEYSAQVEKILAVCPDSVEGVKRMACPAESPYYKNYFLDAIGYHKTSPFQILSFYNAVANNGLMVQPHVYAGKTTVINPQIANLSHIKDMQKLFEYTVERGGSRRARSNVIPIAGASGEIDLADDNYLMDFCGYFPAENPRYIALISMKKQQIPASATICGQLFKEIAETIVCAERKSISPDEFGVK